MVLKRDGLKVHSRLKPHFPRTQRSTPVDPPDAFRRSDLLAPEGLARWTHRGPTHHPNHTGQVWRLLAIQLPHATNFYLRYAVLLWAAPFFDLLRGSLDLEDIERRT